MTYGAVERPAASPRADDRAAAHDAARRCAYVVTFVGNVAWGVYAFVPLGVIRFFRLHTEFETEDTDGIRYDEVQRKKRYPIDKYEVPAVRAAPRR